MTLLSTRSRSSVDGAPARCSEVISTPIGDSDVFFVRARLMLINSPFTNRFHVPVRLLQYWVTDDVKVWKKHGSYNILTLSVIYYCIDSRQHGIYLFVIVVLENIV